MATRTYYPSTNDGRAAWWQNILDHGGPIFTGLGLVAAQSSAILADAAWGVYSYGTVRHAFDEFIRAVYQYADNLANGTPGGRAPAAPAVPAMPAPPTPAVDADFESRREKWVQIVKHLPGYTTTIGASLGLEGTASRFDPNTYQCDLYGMASLNAHTVGGRFRKANGQVEGINLYGRKLGATAWTLLARCTVTPFTAAVPLTGAAPEQWEFMARAVARDVEFGLGSAISEVVVRP